MRVQVFAKRLFRLVAFCCALQSMAAIEFDIPAQPAGAARRALLSPMERQFVRAVARRLGADDAATAPQPQWRRDSTGMLALPALSLAAPRWELGGSARWHGADPRWLERRRQWRKRGWRR